MFSLNYLKITQMQKQSLLLVFLLLLSAQLLNAQSNFITKWDMSKAAPQPTQLSFGTATSGTVNYSWQEISPGTASGSGTWSGNTLTIAGLPANAIIRLQIEPTNFQRININSGSYRARLLEVEQWGTTAWTSMQGAFYTCPNLQVTATDIPNLAGVSDMSNMFTACTNLNSPTNINSWNTSTVTNMRLLFYGAAAFNQNIGSWNTGNVTDMSGMFTTAFAFNQNIGAWNTGKVTNMSSMFYNAKAFNQNIGAWITDSVTDMSNMFYLAGAFNQNIGTWNTGNVKNMAFMFRQASIFNQNIGTWNTSNVTNMSGMFNLASAFNQNIGAWNTSNVTDMSFMFLVASAFNQNIGMWNTGNVTNMSFMFSRANVFNQNIRGWNTSNVTDMSNMFYNNIAFNQHLGTWNLNAISNMQDMLSICGMNCENYSSTLIGWSMNPNTPSGISLGATGRQYGTNAVALRTNLTGAKGWTISGDAASGSVCGDYVWLGNTTQWSTPTNWSGSVVPNSCAANVLIPSSPLGGLFPLIDLAPYSVGNITIEQGATLTLNNLGQLFVCGNFVGGVSASADVLGTNGKVTLQGSGTKTITGKINFSTLIVKSGAGTYTNTGDITIAKMYVPQTGVFTNSGTMTFLSTSPTDIATIDLTTGNTGTLTGNIVAQRFVPVSGSNQHYVSTPVDNLPLTQLGASGTAGYVVPTGTCDETVLASGSPYGSVFRYNEDNGASCSLAGWEVLTGGNAENARGYSAYLTGAGAPLALTGVANMNNSYTKAGNTNSGWTNTTLQGRTQNAGWALVGNPYLSTIDLASKTATGFDNQAQVWQTSGPYTGTYQPVIMGGGSAFVAPFQGFMVHKTAVGGSSTFGVTRNECVNSTSTFYKTGNGNGTLSLKVSGNGFNDITKLTFDDQATNQFDIVMDANKLPGRLTQPMIATNVNNISYSINNLASIETNPSVPVMFMAGTNGNYTITVDDINTFDPTVMIYLEDKVTNAPWIDLRQNNVYTFAGTTAQTKDRFELHFGPAAFAVAKAADCNSLGAIALEQEGNTAWSVSVKEIATSTIKATAQLASTSPMTVAGLQTGDYEVTMVHSSGYTVVKTLTVTGSNPLTATSVSSNATPKTNEMVSFTSTINQPNANVSWDFGDGTTSTLANPTHSYSTPGKYMVLMTVTSAQGCEATSVETITVSADVATTSINTIQDGKVVGVYSKDGNKVMVSFDGYKNAIATIGIYNIVGQELYFGTHHTNTLFEHSIDKVEAQYIIVKVTVEGKSISRKLILTN
jgi:surface protein